MEGYYEYAAPEADPIADLADAVDNSPLQQNRKFVDNTEYYLVPVAVIDAVLAADVDDEDVPEVPEGILIADVPGMVLDPGEAAKITERAPGRAGEPTEFVALENPVLTPTPGAGDDAPVEVEEEDEEDAASL